MTRASSSFSTSPGCGKRPNFFLEKIRSLPTVTSKTPPWPLMRRDLMPNFFSISAARLAARG